MMEKEPLCLRNADCQTGYCAENGRCDVARQPNHPCSPSKDTCSTSIGTLTCSARSHRCTPNNYNVAEKKQLVEQGKAAECESAMDCPFTEYCNTRHQHHCEAQIQAGETCEGIRKSLGRECVDGVWCWQQQCRRLCHGRSECAEGEACVETHGDQAVCMPASSHQSNDALKGSSEYAEMSLSPPAPLQATSSYLWIYILVPVLATAIGLAVVVWLFVKKLAAKEEGLSEHVIPRPPPSIYAALRRGG